MISNDQKITEPTDAPNTEAIDYADEYELQRIELLKNVDAFFVDIPGSAFKPAGKYSDTAKFFHLHQFDGYVSGYAQGSTRVIATVPIIPKSALIYGFYPFLSSEDLQFDVSLYRVNYRNGTSTSIAKARAISGHPGKIIPRWVGLSEEVGSGMTSFHVHAELRTSSQRIYGVRIYYRI